MSDYDEKFPWEPLSPQRYSAYLITLLLIRARYPEWADKVREYLNAATTDTWRAIEELDNARSYSLGKDFKRWEFLATMWDSKSHRGVVYEWMAGEKGGQYDTFKNGALKGWRVPPNRRFWCTREVFESPLNSPSGG